MKHFGTKAAALLAGAAVCMLSACADMRAQHAGRDVVQPPGMARGSAPYSPGVRAGSTIYVSGQVGGEAGPDIRSQATAALRKIGAIVEAAGTSTANIDKCTVFLTNQADFAVMNEVWRSVFPHDPPARTTVIVAALARPEFLIEMDCNAHL